MSTTSLRRTQPTFLPVRLGAWATWTHAGFAVTCPPPPAEDGGLQALAQSVPLKVLHPRVRRPDTVAEVMVRAVHALMQTHTPGRFPAQTGLCIATSASSAVSDAVFTESLRSKGRAFGSPSAFVYTLSTSALAEVSIAFGFTGEALSFSGGAVAGIQALIAGASRVASGEVDVCLAGACDVGRGRDVLSLFVLEKSLTQDEGLRATLGFWAGPQDATPVSMGPAEALLPFAAALAAKRPWRTVLRDARTTQWASVEHVTGSAPLE